VFSAKHPNIPATLHGQKYSTAPCQSENVYSLYIKNSARPNCLRKIECETRRCPCRPVYSHWFELRARFAISVNKETTWRVCRSRLIIFLPVGCESYKPKRSEKTFYLWRLLFPPEYRRFVRRVFAAGEWYGSPFVLKSRAGGNVRRIIYYYYVGD